MLPRVNNGTWKIYMYLFIYWVDFMYIDIIPYQKALAMHATF